jgi:GAF domain-containing protein/HAMP domain-containing protein
MTQSNILIPEKPAATKEQKISSVFRIAVIMLVAAFTVEAFYLFLAFQTGAWQMYALAGVIAFFCLLNIIALPVIRQGAPEAGGWLIIGGMLLVFPGASALVASIGFIFAGALIILTTTVASQILPGKQARTAIIASVMAGVLTAILDFIGLEYRLFVPEIQIFIPIITVITLLSMVFFLFMQYKEVINNSLQLKITVWTGATLVVVSIILISYTAITSREEAIRFAESDALSLASAQAGFLRAESEIPLDTARALAQALTSIPDPAIEVSFTRDQINAMLRQVMVENPEFIGTYTLWEPNAFDGQDASFRNQPGHDETGRFIPYWERTADGSVALTPLVEYEIPGPGDWYLIPKQTRRESALAPLIYPVQGVDTLMAAFTVPIIYQGEFYGIAGVDAPITFVQEVVDSIDLYDGTAQAVVLDASGTLIGVSNQPELVDQQANQIFPDFAEVQPRLLAGESFIDLSADGQFLRAFVPIEVGLTNANWVFSLVIPFNQITQAATILVLQEIAIGATLTILALVVLWFLSAQIVRPIRTLTDIAIQVSQGNLNISAQVDAKDETGVLANTFNLMISQLQNLFATLEERVADRTRGLQLAAEVGRSVSEVRALDVLLQDAAEIIRSRFDLYYVQVYLVDVSKTNLLLQAGTGDVGAQLLERGHRLRLDTGSINGRAAVEKRSAVVADTTASATFRPNPLLPDTRSEMAIPLLLGDRLIGVLNLQSSQPNALNEENLTSFEALAGQIAVAIQNANLLEQAEQARAEVEAQARRLVRTGWKDYQDAIHRPEQTGFIFEKNQVLPLDADFSTDEETGSLATPISLTGQQIGKLIVEVEEERQTPQTVELVNIVARQVAQQVENLRLLESAERYRMDAEEAARRLTREGWEEYFHEKADQSLSYLYDLKEVRPHETDLTTETETALNIPIKIREESIGKLSVFGLDTAADPETLTLINTISERLAEHLESLRLLEETQQGQLELNRRAQQLAAVSEISTISSRELDIQKMLATVVHLTQRKFGLYHAHIFTYDEAGKMLQIIACGWKEGDEHEGTHGTTTISIDQEQSLVARAARNRAPVVVNDVHNEPGWLPNAMLPDTQSELAVPLTIGDEILGVLDVQSERLEAFSDEDISIQMTLAAQIATALQNARSFARAQRQAERESLLNAISQKIQSATSVEAVLQIAARELGHALGAPRTIAQLSIKDK